MSSNNKNFYKLFGRRDFLKTAIASGIAISLGNFFNLFEPEFIDPVLADAGSGPFYYGTDSSSATVTKNPGIPQLPQNFYIGRTGIGESIYGQGDSNFNVVAAQNAGFNYTHSYWVLKGPFYKWRNGRDYYQYGRDQAQWACTAFYQHPNASLIGGHTIFADIEGASTAEAHRNKETDDGWTDHEYYGSFQDPGYIDVTKNRQVLEGFFDGIYGYIHSGRRIFNPGVYTTLSIWNSWFDGANYDPQRDFVTWLAGGAFACQVNSNPCDQTSDTKSKVDNSFNLVKRTRFGKMKTILWQYYLRPGCRLGCGDFNISIQNGYNRFYPRTMYLPAIIRHGTGGYGDMNTNSNSMNGYPAPTSNLPFSGDSNSESESTNSYPAPEK